jgi:hypothetical protein
VHKGTVQRTEHLLFQNNIYFSKAQVPQFPDTSELCSPYQHCVINLLTILKAFVPKRCSPTVRASYVIFGQSTGDCFWHCIYGSRTETFDSSETKVSHLIRPWASSNHIWPSQPVSLGSILMLPANHKSSVIKIHKVHHLGGIFYNHYCPYNSPRKQKLFLGLTFQIAMELSVLLKAIINSDWTYLIISFNYTEQGVSWEFHINSTGQLIPHRWCFHLMVVVGFECSWDRESDAGGSVATGRGTHARQVNG